MAVMDHAAKGNALDGWIVDRKTKGGCVRAAKQWCGEVT